MIDINPINPKKLKERMELLGYKQASLAKVLKVDQTLIGKMLNGKVPQSKHLANLCRVLGTSIDYMTDLTDDPEAGALPVSPAAVLAEQLSELTDVVMVNSVNIALGMGDFALFDEQPEETQMPFSRTWIRQFSSAPPNKLYFATGFGDSMNPTIQDADIVLIDTSKTIPTQANRIWAIIHNTGGQIKRLVHTETGYKIVSDNPNIPAENAIPDTLHIIGRVVAIMRKV